MEQAGTDNARKNYRPYKLRKELDINSELFFDLNWGYRRLLRVLTDFVYMFFEAAKQKDFDARSKFKVILEVERPKHDKPIESSDKF